MGVDVGVGVVVGDTLTDDTVVGGGPQDNMGVAVGR